MCLPELYKQHWLKYNEALTHQLRRMRDGSPYIFWGILAMLITPIVTGLGFFIWFIPHIQGLW